MSTPTHRRSHDRLPAFCFVADAAVSVRLPLAPASRSSPSRAKLAPRRVQATACAEPMSLASVRGARTGWHASTIEELSYSLPADALAEQERAVTSLRTRAGTVVAAASRRAAALSTAHLGAGGGVRRSPPRRSDRGWRAVWSPMRAGGPLADRAPYVACAYPSVVARDPGRGRCPGSSLSGRERDPCVHRSLLLRGRASSCADHGRGRPCPRLGHLAHRAPRPRSSPPGRSEPDPAGRGLVPGHRDLVHVPARPSCGRSRKAAPVAFT
jgi:hypothetical protein